MREHLRLGRLFGIDIGINVSVAVIAALASWTLATFVLPDLVPGQEPVAYWVTAVSVTLAFFASLLAHELGHALVARRYGVGVERITLWLLGGVAQLSGEVRRPGDELRLAAAGPATSVAIAAGAWVTANLAASVGAPDLVVAGVVWLATVNVVLAVFNLVPAFPLDGGRMLRAFLWSRRGDRLAATATAARAGTGFAYLLFGAGVVMLLGGAALNGLWFWLLGLFVLEAAKGELASTMQQDLLSGVRVDDIMTRPVVSVPPGLSVAELLDRYVLGAHHSSYPVIDGSGRPIGLIGLAELRAVPATSRSETTVATAARPIDSVVTAETGEAVIDVLGRLSETGATRALVLDAGQLAGLVSLSDVARALDARATARGLAVG
jgi:Zn-dependent protease/predicted transcriptional regulator